jgi:hypothetical protein
MSDLEELDRKISDIRYSDEYRRLLITHRGKMEEDRLYTLNLMISGYETQKKILGSTDPKPNTTQGVFRVGTLKPSRDRTPAKYRAPKSLVRTESVQQAPPAETNIKPKFSAALMRAMPSTSTEPVLKTSGPITTLASRGSPLGRGSLKATSKKSSLTSAASKPVKSLIAEPVRKKIEDIHDPILDGFDLGMTYTEDNIDLDELDLESVESEEI